MCFARDKPPPETALKHASSDLKPALSSHLIVICMVPGSTRIRAETALQDCYHGQFASLADFMEEVTTESVKIPIDWEAMARDAEMGGEFITIGTAHDEVHVFSNR